MKHIVTHMGECFTPINPEKAQIRIEDIAHSLSLTCRAGGHIDRFFSVAQHCINCANEAKARNYSARVQLASLIHDGSEAYIADVTRPVKFYILEYVDIEKRLQNAIYERFLGGPISDDEFILVDRIDNEMLVSEFDVLHRNKLLIDDYNMSSSPTLYSQPNFATRDFTEVETEFMKIFYGIMHAGLVQGR